jgi:hypothetical protein
MHGWKKPLEVTAHHRPVATPFPPTQREGRELTLSLFLFIERNTDSKGSQASYQALSAWISNENGRRESGMGLQTSSTFRTRMFQDDHPHQDEPHVSSVDTLKNPQQAKQNTELGRVLRTVTAVHALG